MIGGLIVGLFIGWVLSWFGIDIILIQGIRDLFGYSLTVQAYYVSFAVLGLLSGFIHK